MTQRNSDLAKEYYHAIIKKNFKFIEKLLHEQVEFIGPLVTLQGKEEVMQAVQRFASFLLKLHIRCLFDSGTQAMVVYDVECPHPFGTLKTASLMDIQEGQIVRIELIYDTQPLIQNDES